MLSGGLFLLPNHEKISLCFSSLFNRLKELANESLIKNSNLRPSLFILLLVIIISEKYISFKFLFSNLNVVLYFLNTFSVKNIIRCKVYYIEML
jgi:hypothetical protein